MFTDIFERKPTDAESEYWKKRFRSDKNSIYKLRPTMIGAIYFHKLNNITH